MTRPGALVRDEPSCRQRGDVRQAAARSAADPDDHACDELVSLAMAFDDPARLDLGALFRDEDMFDSPRVERRRLPA